MVVDLSRFHQTFFEESLEALVAMESGLLELESGSDDPEKLNAVFRAAHSIKGGAGTFGFTKLAELTHALETILDRARTDRAALSAGAMSTLLGAVDHLGQTIHATKDNRELDLDAHHGVIAQLEQLLKGGATAPVVASVSPSPVSQLQRWKIVFRPEPQILQQGNDVALILRELSRLGPTVVRTDLGKLPMIDAIDPELCYLSFTIELETSEGEGAIREVFEWVVDDCKLELAVLPRPAAAAAPVSAAKKDLRAPNTADAGSIRVSTEKIDALINIVGELVITQSMLGQLNGHIDDNRALQKLRAGFGQLERNTRLLQEAVMRIRMVPISTAFQRFSRMTRDLGESLGKKVELRMSGEQTELDKTVMEKIADPLVHLVRNAIDHGLESPEARRAAKKSETGVVSLDASHKGGSILIEVSDDGAGLDADRIRAKAIALGLIDREIPLSDEQVHQLIFEAGLSTAKSVTDVSGRGVGMDVVRKNIKDLGGVIEVRTKKGRGTTFVIRLPLTLAIVDGQLVRVGDDMYVVPLVSIVESVLVQSHLESRIADRARLYSLRGEYLRMLSLREVFSKSENESAERERLLVVVEADGKRAGILVDELLGQQQVVIKSLEANFRPVEGISGATILGDGRVALILDVLGLIQLAQERKQ